MNPSKPCVLIVDDDPRNRKLLSHVLAFKSYEVLEATNGAEGVDLADARLPGLILLDIQMPVLDGYSAVHILKSNPRTRGIAVWALSAYAMPEDEQRMRSRGCDDYLTKPLDIPDLLARISRHFHAHSAHVLNPSHEESPQ